MRYRTIAAAATALLFGLATVAQASFTITEIMADPEQLPQNQYEWVEFFNAGPDYVTQATDTLTGENGTGNLAAGESIPTGTFAVLYNGDTQSEAAINAVWAVTNPKPINWIAVSGFPMLRNGGDHVQITIDNIQVEGTVTDSVDYRQASFPETMNNGGKSIVYCLEPPNAISNNDGANWAITAMVPNNMSDAVNGVHSFGTPGRRCIPEPSAFAFFGLLGLVFGSKRFLGRRNAA